MLIDCYNRKIDYLRISVTDRCNFRCAYCVSAEGLIYKAKGSILSFEEIHRIVKVAVGLGIRRVRITGGEPLVRRDLPLLIEKLKLVDGLEEIALTTNGSYLCRDARVLKKAGLDRINISLDTLVREKFSRITRGGILDEVLSGIEAALTAGLNPLKINTVLLKDFNHDEILSFAGLTRERHIHLRFVEYMPTALRHSPGQLFGFFSCNQARQILAGLGRLTAVSGIESGVASVFRIDGYCGTIGFIPAVSQPFCGSCNKLRLTSDGRLKSCLHSSRSLDLKEAIARAATDEDLAALFRRAVALKQKSHNLAVQPLGYDIKDFSMCSIGG